MVSPPPYRLDEDAAWTAIDAERRSLCALLETLTDADWERQSLCGGWRVRDVAAHLALAQTGAGRAALDLVRARGSFDRMIADSARRHAAVPTTQVIGEIRAMVGSRRTAPSVTHLEALIDVLVHGQDIAIPLDSARPVALDTAATAATRVWTMPWPFSTAFRVRSRLDGLHLVADDTEWAAGEGACVEGPMHALLLLLTGRTAAALPLLSGSGAARLDGAGDDQAGTRNDSSR
jgi:uncharacterized protein (TIGR03083 family)